MVVGRRRRAADAIVGLILNIDGEQTMTKHKRQHFIPSSYLEAWSDPNTPSGQTPYVWRFSKDGKQVKKKAPKKLFYETDMYTIRTPEGKRDLHIEYSLARLEDEFARIRKRTLQKQRRLSSRDFFWLCMFVAAMFARTRAFAKHQSNQWQKVLDMGERIQAAMDSATPEKRQRMMAALSFPHHDEHKSLSTEEVRQLAEHPLQSSLIAYIVQLAPLLYRTPFFILVTTDATGFITSDDPCVWFDPAVYQDPRPFGAGGLVSPTLEITFPLSPHQMLFFGNGLSGSGVYLPVNDFIVNNLNKRTRLSADEFFIANSPTLNPAWF